MHDPHRWHSYSRSHSPPPVFPRTRAQVTASTLSTVIFKDYASAPLGKRLLSLFPGLGYAAGYKVTQRIYKYGGQPWFSDILSRNYKDSFTNAFGERKGKMMMQATAGR